MNFKCTTCKKTYKTKNGIKKHKCKKKTPRARISGSLRKQIWEKYIGQSIEAKCLCCCKNVITPISNCKTFQAGHIISHHNGGKTTIDNLLPICRDCNNNMGTENWDDYVKRNNFPKRTKGKTPPTEPKNEIHYMQQHHQVRSLLFNSRTSSSPFTSTTSDPWTGIYRPTQRKITPEERRQAYNSIFPNG
jgi:5-methylcytosine-specific restriction endonuclease McrA